MVRVTFLDAIRILGAFERHGVEYVLAGSMAMAIQGIVRATRLKAALFELFADDSVNEIAAGDLAGDYPAIHYVPPSGSYWLDILGRLGDAGRSFATVVWLRSGAICTTNNSAPRLNHPSV